MRKHTTLYISAAFVLISILTAQRCAASGYVRGTLQATQKGPVQSFEKDGSLHWYGIPYAKAPEGELRWKAPQPAEKWEGTFQATESRSG